VPSPSHGDGAVGVHVELPPASGDQRVVASAEGDQVVARGGPPDVAGDDVVEVGPGGGGTTAGEPATLVPCVHGPTDAGGDRGGGVGGAQDGVAVDEQEGQLGVGADPLDPGRRERGRPIVAHSCRAARPSCPGSTRWARSTTTVAAVRARPARPAHRSHRSATALVIHRCGVVRGAGTEAAGDGSELGRPRPVLPARRRGGGAWCAAAGRAAAAGRDRRRWRGSSGPARCRGAAPRTAPRARSRGCGP
jgi:hypothetical protein